MAKQFIQAKLEYEWEPFTFRGHHLTFHEHTNSRLQRSYCSHWGPAIYRWKGELQDGPQSGQVGVLIGETSNLRQRIKHYVSGTQKNGNKLWRETFLNFGEIRLYVLKIHSFLIAHNQSGLANSPDEALNSSNQRVLIEQLLVRQAVSCEDNRTWIVNART